VVQVLDIFSFRFPNELLDTSKRSSLLDTVKRVLACVSQPGRRLPLVDVTRFRTVNPLDVFVDFSMVLLYLDAEIGMQHGLYALLSQSQGKNFSVEALFTSLKFIQLVMEGLGDFDSDVLAEMDSESDLMSHERRKMSRIRSNQDSKKDKADSESISDSEDKEKEEKEVRSLSSSDAQERQLRRKNLLSLTSRPAPRPRFLQVRAFL